MPLLFFGLVSDFNFSYAITRFSVHTPKLLPTSCIRVKVLWLFCWERKIQEKKFIYLSQKPISIKT